jgi:DNA-directed RNA polymerase subunit H (RpoH/RPB5)
MDDENFLKTFASSMDKLKKNDVVRIKNISEAKDKTGKIIAICRKSSSRLENMLDFYLQKENGM